MYCFNFIFIYDKVRTLTYIFVVSNWFSYLLREHMEILNVTNPLKAKLAKWLRDEHNRTFIDWLCNRVSNGCVSVLI